MQDLLHSSRHCVSPVIFFFHRGDAGGAEEFRQ